MQTSQPNTFTTIRTEGALLPADLLSRIVHGDRSIEGLAPQDYHLLAGEKVNEATSWAWNRLTGYWASFKAIKARLPQGDPGTTDTRERWLLYLFRELGYERLTTERAIEVDGKSYPISHGWGHVPIHLVGVGVDLDRRSAGVAGAARSSPHSLVQELLNASEKHLWAFVSNGLQLRILRDNSSLSRQSYVEFDLEAMMEGDVYPDFVVLWLLCHKSRVEAERAQECWLEKWSQVGQEQGTRALEGLRGGVEEAIKALGQGFLSHRSNHALRDSLKSGRLTKQDYYRQLLRLVYRQIFLFVAEDRGLLLDPEATPEARELYTNFYSTARFRRLAERQRGTRHADLYRASRLVMEMLGRDEGCPALGLPALGSFLFESGANGTIPDLEGAELANHDFLDAVRELAFTTAGNSRRRVDYRNSGAEELGSVYEALLELHPEVNTDAGTFDLKSVAGNERKTTGSYYTPTSLINSLLDSALDPVLEEAARKPDPQTAILDLKVCDPACGSGHFLIAAAHRIAKRLASVRTGNDEPSPDATRHALRDVIGQCIYGVDLNPMAVELCKVSLWMEALEPGKPLSFIDHHIKQGNSLLGTTPALMRGGIPDEAFEVIEGDEKSVCSEFKRRNKDERKQAIIGLVNSNKKLSTHQTLMYDYTDRPWERLGDFATGMTSLNEIDDSTIEGVRRRQQEYAAFVASQDYIYGRLLADAWCAAFVWKKNKEFAYPITEQVFRKIERSPFDIAPWMREEIERLADQYGFFHFHLAFPDVFRLPSKEERAANDAAGWNGGFDVVLGNPPWEHTELREKEWFAVRRPDIAEAQTGAQRKRMIERLTDEDPALYVAFTDERRAHDGIGHFISHSGRYPLCGRGRINTYAIFAEAMRLVLGTKGRVGVIVPSGIATDDTTKFFFQDLVESRSLVSLYDFENREGIFIGVHRSYKFCLLTMTGTARPAVKGADFVFFALNAAQLSEDGRQFMLSAEDIALLNPNTRTCPIFRSKRDADLTKAVYRRVPVLIREGPEGYEQNPWGISFKQGLFNMTSDSGLFRSREELEAEGWQLQGNIFRRYNGEYLPLYEAKLIHHYDHRWATYKGTDTNDLTPSEKANSACVVLPRYWVPGLEVAGVLAGKARDTQWLFSYRNICRNNDERTLISAVLPLAGVGHSAQLIFAETPLFMLLANLNTFALDYVVRQKLGTAFISLFTTKQLPILPPETYYQSAVWRMSQTLRDWILPRVLELSYTAHDLAPFAKDCGYNGPPFRWDEERRFLLRCELDAAYFLLYSIARDDVDYIMETFPIVKRKDEARHGEYRTKRVILEIYDAMQRASDTGIPYETRLDPPPADPRAAHPSRDGSPVQPFVPPTWDMSESASQPESVTNAPARIEASSTNTAPAEARATSTEPEPTAPVVPVVARPAAPTQPTPATPGPGQPPVRTRQQVDAAQVTPTRPIVGSGEAARTDQQTFLEVHDGYKAPATAPALRVGDHVRHSHFGEGKVTALSPSGDDHIVTVSFKAAGVKRLMAKLARLERV